MLKAAGKACTMPTTQLRLAMFQLGLSMAVLLLAVVCARPITTSGVHQQELAGSSSDTS